jgi:hypothetical protein
MNEQLNERLTRLIKSLNLREIQPMQIHSERLGDLPDGIEVQLSWKQILAKDDPLSTAQPVARVFRPKYEFMVKHGESTIFHQTSIFLLAFEIVDQASFDELWQDESIRKVFLEKQLRRTMWPIFRQHVLDGMSRLAMKPIALPWLM